MKRSLGGLLLVATVILAMHAFADADRNVVEISGDTDGAMSSSLRELLNRVGMSLRSIDGNVEGSANALARVSVDLQTRDPSVVIVDLRTNEVVAKKTVHAVSRRVALEELALFVRFTLDSLVEQERIRTLEADAAIEDAATDTPDASPEPDVATVDVSPRPVVVAPPVAERDASPPPAPTRVGFDLGVFGTAQAFSPEIPMLGGVGIDASVAFGRGRFRPAITFSGAYFARNSTTFDGVAIHAGLVSFRSLPSFALYDGRLLSVDVGLGGGMDVVNIDAHSQKIGTNLQDVTAAVPVGTLAFLGRVPLGSRAAFTFDLLGDADIARREYVVMVDANPVSVVRPLPVRVSALLGISVRLAGEP